MTSKRTVSKDTPFGPGPVIMGVVNVTPDSFSDGGKFLHVDKAIEHGLQLLSEGATILDIGGESSRPGAEAVDIDKEIARVKPVIEVLSKHAQWVSIDSRNAKTMDVAIEMGANIVNDISGLTHDIESVHIVAEAKVHVCLMHMQGTPDVMQKNPHYNNVIDDIYAYLEERISYCEMNRIDRDKIICDPGIGFGKTLEDNLLILSNINKFHDLDVPILLGTSRKSFIGKIDPSASVDERIPGSLASALWGLQNDVQIFRVHDVKEHVQAFKVFKALNSA